MTFLDSQVVFLLICRPEGTLRVEILANIINLSAQKAHAGRLNAKFNQFVNQNEIYDIGTELPLLL